MFAEKPVAASLEELERLQDAWRRAGTAFSSMLKYRYEAPFYRAWQLVREGAVGRVRLLNAQKSYKFGTRPDFMTERKTYGGTLPWVGIHAIDWILWMSGGHFEWVTATQSASEAPNGVCPETTALALFGMKDGMMASLTADYLNPPTAPSHGDDRIRIVGTEGVLEVRDNALTLVNSAGVQRPACPLEGELSEEKLSVGKLPPGNFPAENLSSGDFFTDFLLQAAGKGHCRITAEESFAATRAALLAQQAADSGEKIYFENIDKQKAVWL